MSKSNKKIFINITFLLLTSFFINGCCAIGVETIYPQIKSTNQIKLKGKYIHVANAQTRTEILKIMGEPNSQSINSLKYKTEKLQWRGMAIDCAVFPIPLTLPFIIPTGKGGFVEFRFKENKIETIYVYKTYSKFFGYAASDNESGFYSGNQSGLWFSSE